MDSSRYIHLYLCGTHGLKAFRNSLMSTAKDFKFRDVLHPIAWDRVKDIYNRDAVRVSKGDVKISTLTIDAVNPDSYNCMNVHLAKVAFDRQTIIEGIMYCETILISSDPSYVEFPAESYHESDLPSTSDGSKERIGDLLRYVRYLMKFQWPLSGIPNPLHTLEYLAIGHVLYSCLFLNSSQKITLTNIDSIEIFVKDIFETYFEKWRTTTLAFKQGKSDKTYLKSFLSHQTWLNLRIAFKGTGIEMLYKNTI